jgi:hypothetical protein
MQKLGRVVEGRQLSEPWEIAEWGFVIDMYAAVIIGPRKLVASYRIRTHCEGLGRLKATS